MEAILTAVAELKRNLIDKLDREFNLHQFFRSTEPHEEVRFDHSSAGIRQSFTPTIYVRKHALELDSPFVSLHFTEIEALVASGETPRPASQIVLQRPTVGRKMENKGITSIFRKIWLITPQDDISRRANEYVSKYLPSAEEFWNEFSTVENVFRLLSGDLSQARLYTGPDVEVAKRAVASVSILKGFREAQVVTDEMVNRIKPAHRQELRGWANRFFEANSLRDK